MTVMILNDSIWDAVLMENDDSNCEGLRIRCRGVFSCVNSILGTSNYCCERILEYRDMQDIDTHFLNRIHIDLKFSESWSCCSSLTFKPSTGHRAHRYPVEIEPNISRLLPIRRSLQGYRQSYSSPVTRDLHPPSSPQHFAASRRSARKRGV